MEIIIQPANRTGNYRAYLNDKLLCTSRQPFFDGARALLKLGYPDHLLITMRHADRAYRSFNPVSIGQAAGMTVQEHDEHGIRLTKYRPRPDSMKKRTAVAA